MELIERAAALIWGWPGLAAFLGVGLYMTLCSRWVQFARLGECLGGTLRGFARRGSGGSMSPLQALSAALGGTVGTGNIAGVTLAISLGGPGALFWMWLAAFAGMATKYAEVLLAVKFRVRTKSGAPAGGPMYYIRDGLGRRFMPLAGLFALAGALAAPGSGGGIQCGELRSALTTLTSALDVPVGDGFPAAVGLAAAAAAFAVLSGGAGRLGRVSALMVPGMSALYISACAAVIAANAGRLLPALTEIFTDALHPQAGLAACAGWGLRRGVYSNEAGLGSSPMAHAASSERDCARQGRAGVFEVFADTIVICTLTGLALLTSGACSSGEPTTARNADALATVFGPRLSAVILAACVTVFAFSSILSWGFYGRSCFEFLTRGRFSQAYSAIFCCAVFIGAAAPLDALWLAGDMLNALMAAPNLLALVLLAPVVRRESAGK